MAGSCCGSPDPVMALVLDLLNRDPRPNAGNPKAQATEIRHPEKQKRPENPVLRKPVGATLNEQPLSTWGGGHHGKAPVDQLVNWAGGGAQDIWVDLDGLADELLLPTDRIVVQAKDHFISVPREHEDRMYEVTVLLDGETKARRFPSSMTVLQATRRSLPPRDRPNVSEFEMVDGTLGTTPLDPNATLKAAGVRDGHVLSITKKNGGGG